MSLSSKMSISVDENIKFFSLVLGSICNFERWQNLHARILTLTIKGQITLSMNFFKYSLSALRSYSLSSMTSSVVRMRSVAIASIALFSCTACINSRAVCKMTKF